MLHKKNSFNFRRSELSERQSWNYFDDLPVVALIKNNSLIGFKADYYIRDRVRYAPDGYRRQRLKTPLVKGRPVDLARAMVVWWSLVYQQEINLVVAPAQPYWFWVYLLLKRVSFFKDSGRCYSLELNRVSSVYQGSHGLHCCRSAGVVIPVRSPYEEDLNLNGPGLSSRDFSWSWFQLMFPGQKYLLSSNFNPRLYSFNSYDLRRGSTSVFQVSPYQEFLDD